MVGRLRTHVRNSHQLRFILSLRLYSSFITLGPGSISFRTSLKFLTCPGTSLQKNDEIMYFISDNYDELPCCMENSVDSDEIAS